MPVKRNIVHEEYNSSTLTMDYALLELDEDIIQLAKNNNRDLSIACLNDSKDLVALAGEACWIAGWGATNSESGAFRHGFA